MAASLAWLLLIGGACAIPAILVPLFIFGLFAPKPGERNKGPADGAGSKPADDG